MFENEVLKKRWFFAAFVPPAQLIQSSAHQFSFLKTNINLVMCVETSRDGFFLFLFKNVF